jgi:hypothetical protein
VVSSGFGVTEGNLTEFARHLDQLESDLRGSSAMLKSCVGDPGIFGIVGQVFGAGASKWCAEAGDHLGKYAETISGFSDETTLAVKKYQNGEADAIDAIGSVGL